MPICFSVFKQKVTIALPKHDFRWNEAFGKLLKPSLLSSLTKKYTERQNAKNHSNNRQGPSHSQLLNLNLLTQLRLNDKEEL